MIYEDKDLRSDFRTAIDDDVEAVERLLGPETSEAHARPTPPRTAYTDALAEARAHEKRWRWAEASAAYGRAAKLYAEQNHELRPGDELRHIKRGVVRATCIYRGPTEVEYAGTVYGSLTAAAKAAAADLGRRSAGTPSEFWGLTKKESPTFTAQKEAA